MDQPTSDDISFSQTLVHRPKLSRLIPMKLMDYCQQLGRKEFASTPLCEGSRKIFEQERGFCLVYLASQFAKCLTFALGEVSHDLS